MRGDIPSHFLCPMPVVCPHGRVSHRCRIGWPLGYYDEPRQKLDAYALALGMPNLLTPARAPGGTIITPVVL